MPLPRHGGVSPTERDVDLPGVRDAAHQRGQEEAASMIDVIERARKLVDEWQRDWGAKLMPVHEHALNIRIMHALLAERYRHMK
jgi:hypothetical protein